MQIKKGYTFVLFYLFEYLDCIDSKIIIHNYKNTTGNITGNSLSIITETVVITLIECAKTCSSSKHCVGLFVKRNGGNLKICTLVKSQPAGDMSGNNSMKVMWIRQVYYKHFFISRVQRIVGVELFYRYRLCQNVKMYDNAVCIAMYLTELKFSIMLTCKICWYPPGQTIYDQFFCNFD